MRARDHGAGGIGVYQNVFIIVVATGLLRRDETGSHPHSLRAKCHSGRKTTAIGESATCKDRNVDGIDDGRDKDCRADPADVAAAIDARCDYGVNAVGYGLLRVANSPANGNDINPGGVRGGNGILGAAQTRDQDRNLLFDNDIDHFLDRFRVSRGDVAFRAHRREKDIDAKGLIRDGANGVDFSFDLITRHVRTGPNDSEAACFRNRAGKCAARNKPHAGLKDRIFNSKPFANFRLQSWHIILSA